MRLPVLLNPAVATGTPTAGGRPFAGATARLARSPRFVLTELLLWVSIYPAYLAVRGSTIGKPHAAVEHASHLIALERSVDLFHESTLQHLVGGGIAFFSAYYMLGFGPLIAAVLLWLRGRPPPPYPPRRPPLPGAPRARPVPLAFSPPPP